MEITMSLSDRQNAVSRESAAVPTNGRSAPALRRGSFVLALLVALGVTARTGGAGLDVAIGPVDHSCPVANSCEHR
jgi:hypothetical protein